MFGYRPMPTFTGKEVYKLYHESVLIGVITNLDSDWPWMNGDIKLNPAAEPYKEFFEVITRDYSESEESAAEPVIDEKYLENWVVEDDKGVKHSIIYPGVREGRIGWR
jgi:hypothetical protein